MEPPWPLATAAPTMTSVSNSHRPFPRLPGKAGTLVNAMTDPKTTIIHPFPYTPGPLEGLPACDAAPAAPARITSCNALIAERTQESDAMELANAPVGCTVYFEPGPRGLRYLWMLPGSQADYCADRPGRFVRIGAGQKAVR